MLSSGTPLPRCPVFFDGVPYIDPISHTRLSSVLGARPLGGGGCRSTSTPFATSTGVAGRSTSTPSAAAPPPLAASLHGVGRSTSTLLASSAGYVGRSSATLPTTSAPGDCRPTSTPFMGSARGRDRSMSTSVVASTHGFCSYTSTCSMSTRHTASTGDGDRSSSADGSTSTSTMVSLSAYEIVQLRCLLAAWDSSPTGSAGSAPEFSGIERPPSAHSGTSSWILDTGASFHMTYDSSPLTSIRPVESPVHVFTADGTPLLVAS